MAIGFIGAFVRHQLGEIAEDIFAVAGELRKCLNEGINFGSVNTRCKDENRTKTIARSTIFCGLDELGNNLDSI